MEDLLTSEDEEELREAVASMTETQIVDTLEKMASREIGLISDPRIGGDPELRKAALWNAAAAVAAAERFTQK